MGSLTRFNLTIESFGILICRANGSLYQLNWQVMEFFFEFVMNGVNLGFAIDLRLIGFIQIYIYQSVLLIILIHLSLLFI